MNSKVGGFSLISALREIEENSRQFASLEDGVAIQFLGKELYSEQIQEIRELVVKILNSSSIDLDATSEGEEFKFPIVNGFHLQYLIREPWISPASVFTILLALTR